jgi:hypothetical protein
MTSPFGRRAGTADMGMIGFDIACETARSGPRMQGYLVNDLCKQQVPISSAPTLLSLRKQ